VRTKVNRLPDRRPPAVEFAPPVDSWIDFLADKLAEAYLAEHPVQDDATGERSPS
jgi:hypothetical protein